MVIVKDQSSHSVYLNICTKYQTCENLNTIGRRSCEIIMEEKTPLSHEVVCFQMLDFGTSKSNSEVLKSNSNILMENYFFLENYVTSEGVVSRNVLYYQMLTNILSNYQQCPLPLNYKSILLTSFIDMCSISTTLAVMVSGH